MKSKPGKYFWSSGNDFNPKSSQKWPKSAKSGQLQNQAIYIGLMHKIRVYICDDLMSFDTLFEHFECIYIAKYAKVS